MQQALKDQLVQVVRRAQQDCLVQQVQVVVQVQLEPLGRRAHQEVLVQLALLVSLVREAILVSKVCKEPKVQLVFRVELVFLDFKVPQANQVFKEVLEVLDQQDPLVHLEARDQ